MLRDAPGRVLRASATNLPFRDGAFDGATALWMLYHLEDPAAGIREACRVLRPVGLFAACAPSRDDAPELKGLVEPHPRMTFDAEIAPRLIGEVFDDPEVVSWDRPLYQLPDEHALRDYLQG